MTNTSKNGPFAPDRARELRRELARKITSFVGSEENRATDIPGVTLHRRTAPTAPCPMTYQPSVTVIAQGRKRVDLGRNTFIYDDSRFLLTSVDLPLSSRVIEASTEVPCLALVLKLEMPVVRELLGREEIHIADAPSDSPALAVGETTVEFLSACCRLMHLLSSPQDIPFLGGLIQREIIYRILRGPEGAASSHCHDRRPQPPDGKSGSVDQGKLREGTKGGRSRTTRGHGRVNAPPPLTGRPCQHTNCGLDRYSYLTREDSKTGLHRAQAFESGPCPLPAACAF